MATALLFAATGQGRSLRPARLTRSGAPDDAGPSRDPSSSRLPRHLLHQRIRDGRQYLLVGEKRALAIDAGSGFYDYKALIEKLTSLL